MRTYNDKEIKFKIDSLELMPLYKTKPQLYASAMIFNWLIIGGCIWLCVRFPSLWLYILTVIIVGARMHALAVLMHDATHFRFLKNRKWNDLLTNIFTTHPIFTSIEKYHLNHLAHHSKLNTEEDPDWIAKLGKGTFTFPKSKTEMLLTLGSYLISRC